MKPPIMCRNVLLPQPLGPMMVMNSPSRAMKLSISRMSNALPSLAKVLRRPATSSAIVIRLSRLVEPADVRRDDSPSLRSACPYVALPATAAGLRALELAVGGGEVPTEGRDHGAQE